MNKPASPLAFARKIDRFAAELGGVFSIADLENLLGLPSKLSTARMIRRLIREGALVRASRGIYTTPACDLWRLSARLSPKSYVSMDSALAHHGLIGTVPERQLSALHAARRSVVSCPQGTVRLYSIAPQLLFGFERRHDGVAIADPEKAYLDLLAYHLRGVRFVVDPLKEVRLDLLNRRKLARYLKRYRNPRFVAFVKGVLDAGS